MSLPDRRTAEGRRRWADGEKALRGLGWVQIPGHGWFVSEKDAIAVVEAFRSYDRHTARRYERRLAELYADRLANDPEFVAQVQEIDEQIAAGEWEPGPGLDVDELRRRYLPSGDE